MVFNVEKCEMLHIIYRKSRKVDAVYKMYKKTRRVIQEVKIF